MLRHSFFFAGVCLGATLVVPSLSRADVPPADECPSTDTVGEACSTAGPNFDENGVCVSTTCMSVHPELDSGPSTYACVLCMVTDAGPSPVADASTPSTGQTLHSSSSCAAAPGDTGMGLSALGALGLVVGARWRRRGRAA